VDEVAVSEKRLLIQEEAGAEVVAESTLAAGDGGHAPSSKRDGLLVVGQEPRAGTDGNGAAVAFDDGGREKDDGDRQLMGNLANAEEGQRGTEEECPTCRTKGKGVFWVCDGPAKKHYFCWKCNGYSSAPLDELNYPDWMTQVFEPTCSAQSISTWSAARDHTSCTRRRLVTSA
jgi:hypothetical protein